MVHSAFRVRRFILCAKGVTLRQEILFKVT
jgi:hypothetical protein